MLTLDVCLEMVLPGLSLAEKARRVAEAGYKAVEIWFHDFDCEKGGYADRDLAGFAEACKASGVRVNNVVLNAPDGGIGGSLVKKEDHEGYLKRFEALLPVMEQLDCQKVITCTGNAIEDVNFDLQFENMVDALRMACELAKPRGVTLLLEPLNTHVDHAGYFCDSSGLGMDVVRAVGAPNLKILYDVYHMQIMEGNVIANIRKDSGLIGHFHSAGVPGRHEMENGELNYPAILRAIHETGYEGCFGLEYSPAMEDHTQSLRAQREYLRKAGEFVG